MKTTQEAAAILAGRGIVVDVRTIQRWCEAKLFPGAFKTAPGRRGDWQIPEASLMNFAPPQARPMPFADLEELSQETATLAQAYHQPWARQFLSALRDHHPHPHLAARISMDDLVEETHANKAFAFLCGDLLRRRYMVHHEHGVQRLEPRPIWTQAQIQAARNGERAVPPTDRLRAKDRPIFDLAVQRGYLRVDDPSLALRNLWWRWCNLHNQPRISQHRRGRWYTTLEIDLHTVWEGDGRPRLFSPAAINELSAFLFLHVAPNKTAHWRPQRNPQWVGDMFLPYTIQDLAAELRTMYLKHFPLDPPPNPELSQDWDPTQVRERLLPDDWTEFGASLAREDRDDIW